MNAVLFRNGLAANLCKCGEGLPESPAVTQSAYDRPNELQAMYFQYVTKNSNWPVWNSQFDSRKVRVRPPSGFHNVFHRSLGGQ